MNKQTQYDIIVDIPQPLPVGASIYIKIPSQMKIFNSLSNLILNSAQGYTPIFSVLKISLVSSVNQIIKLTNLIPSSTYYVDQNNFIKFSLLNIQNPATTGTTDNFEIVFYDQDFKIMSTTAKVSQNFLAGKLNNI